MFDGFIDDLTGSSRAAAEAGFDLVIHKLLCRVVLFVDLLCAFHEYLAAVANLIADGSVFRLWFIRTCGLLEVVVVSLYFGRYASEHFPGLRVVEIIYVGFRIN